jgi:hypothetical protein
MSPTPGVGITFGTARALTGGGAYLLNILARFLLVIIAMNILGVSGVVSSAASGLKLWDNADGPSFSDFIDLVNPLQHIPVVSNLYQHETGDTMGSIAKIAGAAVIGGPIGGALALANEVLEAVTGADVTGHLMGFAGMEKPSAQGKTEIIIPKPEEAEPEIASVKTDKIRTTTKEWIYGDLA